MRRNVRDIGERKLTISINWMCEIWKKGKSKKIPRFQIPEE